MRILISLIILAASATTTTTAKLTGNELVLLRMTLRLEMTADVQAAAQSATATEIARTAPLEAVLSGVPDLNGLYATMMSPASDTFTRFNAARALAYVGDARSEEPLAATLRGQSRSVSGATDRSKAALCLLYLGYDLPQDFAFSKLSPSLYPELDTLVHQARPPLSPSSIYGSEQLKEAIRLFLATTYPVTIWGPLSALEAEQESLAAILRGVAQDDRTEALRIPFGVQAYA